MAAQSHNCVICGNGHANHLPMNCPYGTTLSHGTKVSHLSSISQIGFLASKIGRLGPGLYLTTKQHATAIAAHRGDGTGVCVIHCHVRLGSVKDNGRNNDNAGSWRGKYDCCKGLHPKWASNPEFPEWCLKDTGKCVVKEVELVNGVIDGNVNFPNVTIRIKGNCTFRGNITAGNLCLG